LHFRNGVGVGWEIIRITRYANFANWLGGYLLRIVVATAYQTKRTDRGRESLIQYQKSESVDK
jgi:hypothetical protein